MVADERTIKVSLNPDHVDFYTYDKSGGWAKIEIGFVGSATIYEAENEIADKFLDLLTKNFCKHCGTKRVVNSNGSCDRCGAPYEN